MLQRGALDAKAIWAVHLANWIRIYLDLSLAFCGLKGLVGADSSYSSSASIFQANLFECFSPFDSITLCKYRFPWKINMREEFDAITFSSFKELSKAFTAENKEVKYCREFEDLMDGRAV